MNTLLAGFDFRHHSGAYGGKLLPETLGSGCAFLDYDSDGWQDILLVNGMDWPGQLPRAVSTRTGTPRPDSLQPRRSVSPSVRWEPQVEQHGVVAFRSDYEVGPLAICRCIDGVSSLAERTSELLRQCRLVFDDKHPHGSWSVIAQTKLNGG